jgi:hypothetical protein
MACFCSTKETFEKNQRMIVDVKPKDYAGVIDEIFRSGAQIVSVKVTYITVSRPVPRRRSNKSELILKLMIKGRRHCLRPFLTKQFPRFVTSSVVDS